MINQWCPGPVIRDKIWQYLRIVHQVDLLQKAWHPQITVVFTRKKDDQPWNSHAVALKFLGFSHIFSSFCGKFSLKIAGGWEDSCGYGSIPVNPFLVGWTSINPSYFDVNYRGTRFWHTATSFNFPPLIFQRPRHRRLFSSPDRRQIRGQQGDGNLHPKCGQPTGNPTW